MPRQLPLNAELMTNCHTDLFHPNTLFILLTIYFTVCTIFLAVAWELPTIYIHDCSHHSLLKPHSERVTVIYKVHLNDYQFSIFEDQRNQLTVQ